ncbi:DEAD/DEAH box helicase [Tateyamaria omphalii]|uniref:ATP-dependent RNA helicase n=1 Tax=Tateyamaria omphalii TaxID=299262 RepID=A0A1P8MQK9_9RHOB|nr:DEAD/DEAH box helicase [Tateyamaria omphalii]APX10335.1 ATP-dependent RNA helicase [Tateyamaria omphalii]
MIAPLQAALTARGYTDLTPVQTAVTDPALVEADLLVSAQTGSGKTVGFGLALGPTLLGDEPLFELASAPLALVIAPTRELALQVKRELGWLYGETGAVMASCVGGMDMRDERRALARGAHFVVATPGRLRDHIMRGSIDLTAIRGVVLDEADEMLDLGFREDLEFILGECPDTRRTLLFSATVPAQIARLAQTYQKDAVRVATTTGERQHADISYQAMMVANHDAENAIINILRYHEAPNAIVFCNTRAMVNRVTTRLSNRGFPVVALSGELTQSERTNALQSMRDGRARVCVATDVAARGIDLPNLDLVVHAELPSNFETLLHRSGRTGRAGRKGTSALIVTPKVRSKALRVLKGAKLEADWVDAPSADAVRAQDEVRLFSDPMWSDPVTEGEADMVAKLAAGFSAEQLAVALLRIQGQRHSAPEHLSAVTGDKAPKQRAPFGPSVWFSVTGGQDDGVEVRRLLPILCNAGDITKDDIGAIRITADTSYVELKADSADGFIQALGPSMQVEGGATVTRLNGVPDAASQPKPRFAPKPKPAGKRVWDDTRPTTPKRKPRADAAPTEWNDDPAPRPRKPKPGAKPTGTPRAPKAATQLEKAIKDGSVTTPKKPRHKATGKGKPTGGSPKVGKFNSKKNKARRAATQGGTQPPRRKS